MIQIRQPVTAQFGLAGGKKRQGDFQDLQQQAEEKKGGATDLLGGLAGLGGLEGIEGLEGLMAQAQEALKDPEKRKQLEMLGLDVSKGLEDLAKLSPEEIANGMKDFWGAMSDDSIVEKIVENRESVLQTLEGNAAVPAEELAKMKADPKYFELKMRESFSDMQGIMNDPEKYMEALGQVEKLVSDPNYIKDTLKSEFEDDDKLEELRLMMLKGDHPMMAGMMDSPEMQEILKDPKKFKETIQEGMGAFMGMADGMAGGMQQEL
jgi:hypothetical protein